MTPPRFSFLLPVLVAAVPAAAMGQAVVQPLGFSDADRLAAAMRRLAVNASDLGALIEAGELSLRLEDFSGAASLFARADKIDSRNGRVKAGMASILVRAERPGEALRYFQLAESLALAPATFAADRGLAYDLIGEQERAQRDYRLALKTRPDDETVRRYALSLGISGKRDLALGQLAPLLNHADRGAWRARAFVLAMTGDTAEASRIATTMMPPGMATGLQPFLQRLASLPPADRAFAVHFGEVRATPERVADARLTPVLAVLGPDPDAPRLVAAAAPPVVPQGKRDKKHKSRDAARQVAAVTAAAAVQPVQPAPPPPAVTVARAVPLQPAPTAVLAAGQATAPSAWPTRAGTAPVSAFPTAPTTRAITALAGAPPRPVAAATQPYVSPAGAGSAQVAAFAPPPTVLAGATVAGPSTQPAAPATLGSTPAQVLPVPATASISTPRAIPSAPSSATVTLLPQSSTATQSANATSPMGVAVRPSQTATVSPLPVRAVAATIAPAPTIAAAPLVASAGVNASAVVAPVAPAVAPVSPPPAIATVAVPPSAAAMPVSSSGAAEVTPAPVPVVRAGDDKVLAQIVANLAIPATELGITGPARPSAEAPLPAAGLAQATAVARQDDAEKKAAIERLAPRSTAPERPTEEQAAAERKSARVPSPVIKRAVAKADARDASAGTDKAASVDKKPVRDRKHGKSEPDTDAPKTLVDKAADKHAKPAGNTAAERKAAAAKAAADQAAADEKKAARANPERVWVQVAGGASEGDLSRAWKAAKAKAPEAFAHRSGYTTPLRATNRVLAGPFKTDAEARSFVNKLAKKGVSAFTFTSDKGQPVSKLPSE